MSGLTPHTTSTAAITRSRLEKKKEWMMKKLASTLVGLGAMLLVGATPQAHAAICGDLNGSGVVLGDAGDSVLLVQRIFGGPNAGDCGGMGTLQCGDLNGDGSLNVADLVVLLNAIAGNPIVFNCTPTGTPECGVTISGTIGTNRTFQSGCTTTVNGTTFVASGVILKFEPGARVEGVKGAATPSALVFLRGSKINAAGSPAQPIVFTSNQADGARSIGDWGGVVLNGNAPVNCPAGGCLAEGLTGIEFGGGNPNDSSGVIQYARIEYSGIELSGDNELNVLTMNGVGRGTLMDHIQVNHGFDDGFEWFGGTVNMKFLVASSIGDDDFDWQLGYVGSVQFGLSVKNAANSDTNGRHGIEADNNENNFEFGPRSNPRFCNLTMVGTRDQGQTTGSGRRGALLRRGTAGKIHNSIFTGYTENGIRLEDNATAARACASATTQLLTEPFLRVADSIVFNSGTTAGGNITTPCTPANYATIMTGSNGVLTTDPGINEVSIGYPVTVATGATAADGYVPGGALAAPNCQALDPAFFSSAAYMGAFVPGGGAGANWLRDAGTGTAWINFDTN